MTAAEAASGVEYADVSLYAETCPCGTSVPIGDHSHDAHWEADTTSYDQECTDPKCPVWH